MPYFFPIKKLATLDCQNSANGLPLHCQQDWLIFKTGKGTGGSSQTRQCEKDGRGSPALFFVFKLLEPGYKFSVRPVKELGFQVT